MIEYAAHNKQIDYRKREQKEIKYIKHLLADVNPAEILNFHGPLL